MIRRYCVRGRRCCHIVGDAEHGFYCASLAELEQGPEPVFEDGNVLATLPIRNDHHRAARPLPALVINLTEDLDD